MPINVVTGVVGVLVVSQVFYATLWKTKGIAPSIEQATSRQIWPQCNGHGEQTDE